MSKPNYKEGGLKPDKYRIEVWDEEEQNYIPTKHEAQYFVLRVDKDPHALKALEFYRHSVRKDNPQFADDLTRWIKTLKGEEA